MGPGAEEDWTPKSVSKLEAATQRGLSDLPTVELVSVTVEVDEERVACVAVVIADYCIRRAGGYRRRCVGVVVAVVEG